MIGFAGTDNKGLGGLELEYNHKLAGRPGRQTIIRDATGQAIDTLSATPERQGQNLFTTIDSRIQANAEAVLRKAVTDSRATSASAIVLDPRTGAILAMAQAPVYDANNARNVPYATQRNRAVTDTYEPGSTFKLVTIAGALSQGIVTALHQVQAAVFDSRGRPRHPRRRVPPDGVADRVGILSHSVERRCRDDRGEAGECVAHELDRAVRLRQDDPDRLPGESAGFVLPLEKWYRIDDRQRADRTGHLRDADPDGVGVRRDRERRRLGAAASRRADRRQRRA